MGNANAKSKRVRAGRSGERRPCPKCGFYTLWKPLADGMYVCLDCGHKLKGSALPLAISRQRYWQLSRQVSGRCILCGKQRGKLAVRCEECQKKLNERRSRA